jgi:hypothetical protein
MSVDTRVVFPPETRVSDVVTAIAILLGYEPELVPFRTSPDAARYVRVVETKNAVQLSLPQMVLIQFPQRSFWASYHFEANSRGERLLMTYYDDDRLPLLTELARFFGGKIDFSDCDGSGYDRAFDYPGCRLSNAPEDGEAWQTFENDLYNLKETACDVSESAALGWPER